MRPVPWGELVALVRRAGEAILPHWRADVAVRSKADESP
ncbi:3'(2'),5'-bisphosphate nucleotidase CysQ, partial [Pseudomonas aeruginosa]|nr:3'(2'),5'-bisphosphate nucleotidase CysQ [Pseudomonas aeruginosa]